jgi:hypothetical protein
VIELSKKVERLGERVDQLSHGNDGDDLTTEEANLVRSFWRRLHWTDEEAEEYSKGEKRMEEIHVAAGSVYLGSEENREYMRLSKRSTELQHDIIGKRLIANEAMRARVWPELVPRVLRFYKLTEKPVEELANAEAEELEDLLDWFIKLRAEAIETAEKELAKTSGTSGGESENCQ